MNKKELRLLAQRCSKVGFTNCIDFWLVWSHENKCYKVRINPVFADIGLLYSNAEKVPAGEDINKYI